MLCCYVESSCKENFIHPQGQLAFVTDYLNQTVQYADLFIISGKIVEMVMDPVLHHTTSVMHV